MSRKVLGVCWRREEVRGRCVRSTGWDISDVLFKTDIWDHLTIIIFSQGINSGFHTAGWRYTVISVTAHWHSPHTQTRLTPLSYLLCPHKQGVSCPLLFLPSGAESLWKLLVNGHLILPPTACHHLLSRHYSGPLRLPACQGGVANRSATIGQTVAALPKGQPIKACSSTSHSRGEDRCR